MPNDHERYSAFNEIQTWDLVIQSGVLTTEPSNNEKMGVRNQREVCEEKLFFLGFFFFEYIVQLLTKSKHFN